MRAISSAWSRVNRSSRASPTSGLSIVASRSPALTSWPIWAVTERTTPGARGVMKAYCVSFGVILPGAFTTSSVGPVSPRAVFRPMAACSSAVRRIDPGGLLARRRAGPLGRPRSPCAPARAPRPRRVGLGPRPRVGGDGPGREQDEGRRDEPSALAPRGEPSRDRSHDNLAAQGGGPAEDHAPRRPSPGGYRRREGPLARCGRDGEESGERRPT